MPNWPKRRAFGGRLAAWARAVMLGAFLAGGTPIGAQTALPASQILTLDQDRLYAESLYGKALEARLSVVTQALVAENRKIEQDLAAEEADLTRKRPTMVVATFQVLADAFDAKVEQVRTDQAAKVEAVKVQREEVRKAFRTAWLPVLAEMMQQMGVYAILNRSTVAVSFDSIDVTDRAIRALDAKLGDGSTLGTTGPRLPAPTDGIALGTTAPTP